MHSMGLFTFCGTFSFGTDLPVSSLIVAFFWLQVWMSSVETPILVISSIQPTALSTQAHSSVKRYLFFFRTLCPSQIHQK